MAEFFKEGRFFRKRVDDFLKLIWNGDCIFVLLIFFSTSIEKREGERMLKILKILEFRDLNFLLLGFWKIQFQVICTNLICDKGENEGGEKVNRVENEAKFSFRKMVKVMKLNWIWLLISFFYDLVSFVSFLRTISVYTILLTRGSLNR